MEVATYTDSNWTEDNSLTYEKLVENLKNLPPVKFSAFTVTAGGLNRLQAATKMTETESFPGCLMGLPVYVLYAQTEDFIHWTDKNALDVYLEMMNVREPSSSDNRARKNALVVIGNSGSGIRYDALVRQTLHIPTDHLIRLVSLNAPVIEPAPGISEAFKKLVEDIDREVVHLLPNKKQREPAHTPFYSKFVSRKRK